VVQVFSVNNFSVSSSQIVDVVKRRWGMDPGKQRVGRWVERCDKELGWWTCRPLSDHRTGALVVEDVKYSCEQLETFLNSHLFRTEAVFICNKTRLLARGGRMTKPAMEVI